MVLLKESSHRGWTIRIFTADEGYIAASFFNEYGQYDTEEDMNFQDADECEKHVVYSINVVDWCDPQFRSAEFKDIDPDPIPELGYGV
jgi:hypothetical protein